MNKYKIKIGYEIEFDVRADSRKEAKEIGWFEFDQIPHEPSMSVTKYKLRYKK